ncbi:SPOPL [Cordylochernes scorpioides]|uniref:SPOPL n=1 Tax=Cordylochernes scorpioides TaxID=51811 RepID=A0ABY6KM03_9ARAC|nr:SPOPL [Cordylochernes scorpioides]
MDFTQIFNEIWEGQSENSIKYCFVWRIENFILHLGSTNESSSFSSPLKEGLKWELTAYLGSSYERYQEYLKLQLKHSDSQSREVDVLLRCSLLNSKEEKVNTQTSFFRMKEKQNMGWSEFIKGNSIFDEVNGLLPSGNLTIFCQIVVIDDSLEIIKPTSEWPWLEQRHTLFSEQKFCDVVLNVGDHSFKANKNILAPRSKVFAAMFDQDVEQDQYMITDMDKEVLQELLRFIYTDNVLNLSDMADRLLMAADKHELKQMKALCEDALSRTLTLDNAIDVLLYSDKCNAEQLKAFTIHFITIHSADISENEDWKSKVLSQPSLLTQLQDALALQQNFPFSNVLLSDVCHSLSQYSKVAKTWCVTKFDINDKKLYTWKINSINLHDETNRQKLESSLISIGSYDWVISLYPNGEGSLEKGYLSVFLELVTDINSNVKTHVKFILFNSKGEEIKSLNDFHIFGKYEKKKGYSQFLKRNILVKHYNKLLPFEKLSLLCEITLFCGNVKTKSGRIQNIQFKLPESRWSEEVGSLLESPKFSDVVLKAGGYTVQAHKNILAARSPVFAAMFEHDMKENKENLVEIEDMEPEVLEEMVRFIYTEQSPKLYSMAERLLPAADKYGLERLKVMCLEFLASHLTKVNAANVLVLADKLSNNKLKKCAIDFIIANYSEVKKTKGFLEISNLHQCLRGEIFQAQIS